MITTFYQHHFTGVINQILFEKKIETILVYLFIQKIKTFLSNVILK